MPDMVAFMYTVMNVELNTVEIPDCMHLLDTVNVFVTEK